jgi:hypothetical protein
MKKKIKYFVLIVIMGILIIPRPASADVLGIVNTIQASLGGIEEISRSVAIYIFKFFFVYIVSIASLYTSAHLLQFTTENTQWLSVYNNEMVRSGWHFTSGIANMLIVLILMVIALSFIFKRETFEIKKTLPKLLMVALLINFSLVFVGALVDISNIIFNTILDGNQGLPFQIIDTLGVGMWGIANNLMLWIVALAVAFAIPVVSSFAQLAMVTGFVNIFFLPNILIWLFQIFSSFSMSMLFFTYAFLFGARIFIIQMLAIVSPLAFLCSILPQTKKYWDEWLNHLIQWLFLGISLFFFLVIGLRAASWIMPPGVSYPFTIAFGWLNLEGYFVYYFFLFIYLAVAGWMSKKAMPTVATAIITQGKELGGFMWKQGLKPLGGAFTRATRQATVEQRRTEEAAAKEGRKLRLREQFGKVFAGGVRGVYRVRGTTPETVSTAERKRKEGEIKKTFGKDFKSAAEVYSHEDRFTKLIKRVTGRERIIDEDRAVLALHVAKTGGVKGIEALSPEKQKEAVKAISRSTPDRLREFVSHKPELIDDEDVKGIVRKTLVPKGMEDEDVRTLIKIGAASADDEDSAIRKAAFKKAVDAMKTSDIENLSLKTIESKDFQEMVLRFKPVSFIRKIGEEKGSKYIETLRQAAQKLGVEQIAMTNLTLLRQSVTNPGFSAIFPPLQIKDPDTEDERIMKPKDMEWIKEKAEMRRQVEREDIEREKKRKEKTKTPPIEKRPPGTTGPEALSWKLPEKKRPPGTTGPGPAKKGTGRKTT